MSKVKNKYFFTNNSIPYMAILTLVISGISFINTQINTISALQRDIVRMEQKLDAHGQDFKEINTSVYNLTLDVKELQVRAVLRPQASVQGVSTRSAALVPTRIPVEPTPTP